MAKHPKVREHINEVDLFLLTLRPSPLVVLDSMSELLVELSQLLRVLLLLEDGGVVGDVEHLHS